MRRAAAGSRRLGLFLCLGAVIAGCTDFDTSRSTPPRGSAGEEIYGVICDRVGAQALREDLSGDSFRALCHRTQKATYADKVDVAKLVPIDQTNAAERHSRAKSIGRIESLARRRNELIAALDATFPPELATDVADVFGRMTDLYNDGTIPQSTESIARLVDAFRKSEEATAAWSRMSSREGYRPFATSLGVVRAFVAYPDLRDLSSTTLRLIARDSDPYTPRDANRKHVPVPGPANATFAKLLEAAHAEMLNATADPPNALLAITTDPKTKRPVLSRPRDNLEILETLLLTMDDAFGSPSTTEEGLIVRRDRRGYAALSQSYSAFANPNPFLDADHNGLPDVDDRGRYHLLSGAVAPSPFRYATNDASPRDPSGRALINGAFVYDTIDTNRTFAAHLLDDVKPLTHDNSALMDLAGGLYVALGARVPAKKSYGAQPAVSYSGISSDAALLDLLYGTGIILGDRSADATLAMAHDLMTNHERELARLVGSLLNAQETAKKHSEAKIPRETTFWDDALEIVGKMSSDPALMKDVLLALGDPATANLGNVLAKDVSLRDDMAYDKSDINGAPRNVATGVKGSDAMSTPVDRNAKQTGANRSALERVLMLLSDSQGVTICNKADALLHAKKTLPLLGEVDITLPTLALTKPLAITIFPDRKYAECGVIKIDDLAVLYIDAMADASHVRVKDPRDKIPPGTLYLRNTDLRNGDLFLSLPAWVPGIITEPLRSLGKPTVGLMAQSSRLTGFWEPDSSVTLAPKPEWLARFAHFDFAGDTENEQTKKMIGGLMGEDLPTSLCRVEVINDPEPNQIDANADKKIRVRRCNPGQHFSDRNNDTLFLLEQAGFFNAIRPLLQAFVKHKAEDLFIGLAKAAYKYYPNQDASIAECTLPQGQSCTHQNMKSYEPLLAEQLVGDLVPALNALLRSLSPEGIDALVNASRALFDSEYAKSTLALKDRKGNAGTMKNDGTPIAQVTPAYLLTNALNAIDASFDAYEAQHPEDPGRRDAYRNARSKLADQFLAARSPDEPPFSFTPAFRNPTMSKMAPVLIDVLRAQLHAHCPTSFAPPYDKCTWAREELAQKATATLTGPLASQGLELLEVLRRDQNARVAAEHLLTYLVSDRDARPSVIASMVDIVQSLRDEEDLIPLLHVMATALEAGRDRDGAEQPSLVDAQMALLMQLLRKQDGDGRVELDPNQALTKSFAKLVTPMKSTGSQAVGLSPLEVIMDVIADVNRVDPTQPYAGSGLAKDDYVSVGDNVVDFLLDPERGLEQFYSVVREGTLPR